MESQLAPSAHQDGTAVGEAFRTVGSKCHTADQIDAAEAQLTTILEKEKARLISARESCADGALYEQRRLSAPHFQLVVKHDFSSCDLDCPRSRADSQIELGKGADAQHRCTDSATHRDKSRDR